MVKVALKFRKPKCELIKLLRREVWWMYAAAEYEIEQMNKSQEEEDGGQEIQY